MKHALAITFAVGAVLSSVAHGGSPGARFNRDGVSFQVPRGWQLTIGRLNGVIDPVTLFTASTFRVRTDAPSNGMCAHALQRAWRRDGAYVQLTEERDGASRRRMLLRVPQRPKHFQLDVKGAGGLCTPRDSGEIAFQENGRAFYVFYGFGTEASRATRAQAEALLDNLRIARRKP